MTLTEEHPYKELISDELMQKTISALMKQVREHVQGPNSSGKKSVFADASNKRTMIHLDIQSFKVPVSSSKRKDRPLHPKINRLSLPHTLTDGNSGVLLVTKDYPKPDNHTVSNAHFQKLLTAAGANHLISEVMSVSQLKAEQTEFEARKELCSRIDVVLCDTAVTDIVPRLLGKPFLQAKKFPLAIKMNSSNLKQEIERKLSYTAHKMNYKNTQSAFIIGHTCMAEDQLVENLRFSLQYLCNSKFPGMWANVKMLYLTAGLTGRVPLYVSTGSASDVRNIIIVKPEPEIYEGDFGFGNVKVTSDGHVLGYDPHSDDEEPIAVNIRRKREGPSSVESGPEQKKRKVANDGAKHAGQLKRGRNLKRGKDSKSPRKGSKRPGKGLKSKKGSEGVKKEKKFSHKTIPSSAGIHTTKLDTF